MTNVLVLDTSVLLQDAGALEAFADAELVIPGVVLEEIDNNKVINGEVGRNARQVARQLDRLRGQGRLNEGVLLPNGALLRVEINHRSLQELRTFFPEVSNDNRLLAVALNLSREESLKKAPRPVVLVSRDALLRVKADALGLTAIDYEIAHLPPGQLYRGWQELLLPPEDINEFYRCHTLSVHGLAPNQFAILRNASGGSQSALGRVDADGLLKPLMPTETVWGVMPRNAQQRMALELLLDDRVPLVTLTGPAGTGKTLLSLAVGLLKTQDEGAYRKLLIARPVVPMGRDLGYLPGSLEDKLRPWMQPVYDNLEFLFHNHKGRLVEEILLSLPNVQVEALTYIRGRTLPQQFIIIDEAQNLTRHEAKTIISRAGEGSKVVLVGDPEQIDHPHLDAVSNGLAYVAERFRVSNLAGHVHLVKGERSPLAQAAVEFL